MGMNIIGICGKSGSGKSTYARRLSRERGALLIDVDKVVHELLAVDRVRDNINKLVGTDFKTIDRKALGKILFNNKPLLKEYNQEIYKEIEFVIDRILSSAQGGGVDAVIDWALLPMTKYYDMCTEKHLIKKGTDARKRAVLTRDDIDEEYFDKREEAALEYNEPDFKVVREFDFKSRALFAGTFDPFTMGHLDIVQRASQSFEEVVVGIAVNPEKLRRFDKDSMQHAILKTAKDYQLPNVDCVVYGGLTGEKALEMECYWLVRGVRDDKDMPYEKQIENFNSERFGLKTFYFKSPEHLKEVSSSRVKTLMSEGKPIDKLVPPAVEALVWK